MDYHYATKQIFWSDPKSKKIYSALMELNQKSLPKHGDDFHLPLLTTLPLQLHKVRPLIENLSGVACLAGKYNGLLTNHYRTNALYLFQSTGSITDCSGRIQRLLVSSLAP